MTIQPAPEFDEAQYNLWLGRAVAGQMKLRGVTGLDLARAIGMERSALSIRVNGRTPFKAAELARIALVLKCSVNDFHEWAARGSNPEPPASQHVRRTRSVKIAA